ncbi:MAG: zf-HC2 domain-containing protein [Acidobacteria bacterium]|nr:zf-HC2 domain-containing protein [Acidobacteriota bacterium]
MICTRARLLLSRYLDGAVTGREMQWMSAHLARCPRCRGRVEMLQITQSAVARLGRKQPPPELALQIRLAISREAARTPSHRWQSFVVRFQHAFNAFMVPATAGMLSAVILFGLLLGLFAVPSQLQAASSDVNLPMGFYSPPALDSSLFGMTVNGTRPGSVTVQATVDPNGRMQDYTIVSSDGDEQLSPEIENILIFSTFRPAMSFGRPTTGKIMLVFSKIPVKG